MNVTWRDAGRSLPGPAGVLQRDERTTADLHLAYTFRETSQWVRRFPWLNATTAKLSIRNLFDDRPDVRDADGRVPAGSSPAELDPLGQTWMVEVHKVFQSGAS